MTECIITSSLLIAVVIALRFLFRGKISRRLQYALWGLVLLRLLMPFSLFASPLSIMNAVPNPLPISEVPVDEPSGRVVSVTGLPDASVSTENVASPHFTQLLNTNKILHLVWLIGILVVGSWVLIVNYLLFKKLHHSRRVYDATNFKLPVYVSEDISSPCLFGILHPAVYLTPKAAERKESTSHILAHELSHYRHGDHIWLILRNVCLIVYWWNPLVWAAAILSRIDSELACDEAVIKQIGEENRLAYGHTLVDMIAVSKAPSSIMYATTTMVSGKHSIHERLNMLIKHPKTVIPAMLAVLLVVSICVGCTFTGASGGMLETEVHLPNTPDVTVSYGLIRMQYGEVSSTLSPLPDDEAKLAEDLIFSYLIKSAAWPGVDITTLKECYLLRATYLDGTTTDYYAYSLDGKPVMQVGTDGYYSRIDDGLYQKLVMRAGGDGYDSRINEGLYEKLAKLAQRIASVDSGNDGSTNLTSKNDRGDLNICISDAIKNANMNPNHESDLATEAHIVLKSVDRGNTTTVYAMALYLEFNYENGELSEAGGSHMPVAITFEKSAAGDYELNEYWIPKDGSYYAPSIKEKFPSAIYAAAHDTQKYILAETQVCYAQAIEYGKVNTDAILTKLVETICSSPAAASNPGTYIEAHPIEYRALMYYGDYTLRYAYGKFLQGGQTDLKSHILLSAMRELLGAENLKLSPTGTAQEYFDQWKNAAERQLDANSMEYMQKNYPKTAILLQLLDQKNSLNGAGS